MNFSVGAERGMGTFGGGSTSPEQDRRISAPVSRAFVIDVDHSRDALLTDFGKETLNDRYLLPGES